MIIHAILCMALGSYNPPTAYAGEKSEGEIYQACGLNALYLIAKMRGREASFESLKQWSDLIRAEVQAWRTWSAALVR